MGGSGEVPEPSEAKQEEQQEQEFKVFPRIKERDPYRCCSDPSPLRPEALVLLHWQPGHVTPLQPHCLNSHTHHRA